MLIVMGPTQFRYTYPLETNYRWQLFDHYIRRYVPKYSGWMDGLQTPSVVIHMSSELTNEEKQSLDTLVSQWKNYTDESQVDFGPANIGDQHEFNDFLQSWFSGGSKVIWDREFGNVLFSIGPVTPGELDEVRALITRFGSGDRQPKPAVPEPQPEPQPSYPTGLALFFLNSDGSVSFGKNQFLTKDGKIPASLIDKNA
jgi:hypothetical protein